MDGDSHPRLQRALASFRNEWHEAPWLVVLVVVVVAFVGPGLLWAGWSTIAALF